MGGTVLQIILILTLLFSQVGCSYLDSTMKQAGFSMRFSEKPSQKLYKHMLTSEKFFVFGKIENGTGLNPHALAIVALSNLHQEQEVVDISHCPRLNSFYGLNLPAGRYQLAVLSDLNRDGIYDEHEVVGGRQLDLDPQTIPGKVVGEYHIDLEKPFPPPLPRHEFRLPVKKIEPLEESIFYPQGSIRSLDDPLFSPQMARLGMYEPAAFMEEAPMMFYALEEDLGYKVPVVFVHGIDGSARDFAGIVARLDRHRYRPWFFYYPSGNSLEQLGEMFYKIFLSGKTIALGRMEMVIVAHSMGGLVVREALNRLSGSDRENRTARLITLASPLGGHPAAAMASKGPVVIPSWRDVDPESSFMRNLRRQKLPTDLEYHLFYAFGNEQTIRLGENSDGVVPLSSQLCREAQEESTIQFGFNATHTGILVDPEVIGRVLSIIESVRAPFPEEHMTELFKGGYEVPLVGDYSPIGRYCIRHIGRWLEALESGRISPIDELQEHFLKVIHGSASANTPVEKDWLQFIKEYPQRTGL